MSDDKLMVRRLVLDILKPFDPELHIVATEIINKCQISKEVSVNLTVNEVDKLTQTVKFTIEGKNLDFDEIHEILNSMNCIIHSVDQVAAGKKIVENINTPQD